MQVLYLSVLTFVDFLFKKNELLFLKKYGT